jgi:hypothetical protein
MARSKLCGARKHRGGREEQPGSIILVIKNQCSFPSVSQEDSPILCLADGARSAGVHFFSVCFNFRSSMFRRKLSSRKPAPFPESTAPGGVIRSICSFRG